MRNVILVIGAVLIGVSANAAPQGGPMGEGKGMKSMMPEMTDEQKTCVEQYGCPEMETKSQKADFQAGQKGDKPQMSETDRAAMESSRECQTKAFEACGIQMPQRPERMDVPDGKSMGERGVKTRS